VLADEGGLAELRRLGARSVPVVSRGDRFVFTQVIGEVVDFLALDEQTGPALSPAELHARYDHVLETAIRLVRQMPDDRLEDQLPHRSRSYLMLMTTSSRSRLLTSIPRTLVEHSPMRA